MTNVEIGVFPPALFLADVADALTGSNIIVGAQNMHFEENGAFTGEISAPMIQSVGGTHVILGHSERRHVFGETDDLINRKLVAAHQMGLSPVICVGETLETREANETTAFVEGQVRSAFNGITVDQARATVVAYEPVWAIGTGRTATPDQAQEAHAFLRTELTELFGAETAAQIRIQYGGSVKPANAAELLGQPDIDGALVGGASLQADSFTAIIRAALGGE